MRVRVDIKKIHKDAQIPEYKTEGAACADLCAVFHDNWGYTYIRPSETKVIQTGLAVEVPEGWEMQIRARSGLASKGLILSNGIGTIDSDYRGEVGVILTNTTPNIMKIDTGMRIAQCCLHRVNEMRFSIVDELSDTERGEGGYGSTGSI